MDLFNSMDIAADGLSVQRKRMDIIASNLANAETTQTKNGGPYRRQDVMVRSVDLDSKFNNELRDAVGSKSVTIARVVKDPKPPRIVYDPTHPDANPEGYVTYPNVNPVDEMVNMMTAQRSFEANMSIMRTLKQMANNAISLLQG